ncbi:MAG: class I SAM-dependent methyltransferase [Syntrophobacteraceae bacterium]
MLFKDHFTKSASRYRKYRPHYPENLFRFLASVSPDRKAAWDCATGSGQAAGGIARYFERVFATDASAGQVRNAERTPGVDYLVSLAESAAFKDASIDLAISAQAAHWFDLDLFYSEAQRVVKPGGIVSIWCYSLFRINPSIDRVIDALYSDILGPYWPAERKLIDEHYVPMYFPFPEFPAPAFEMEASWGLAHLIGYLGTWSSVNRFREARGLDPITLVHEEISRAWGEPEAARRVVWPIHMRIGRR